MSWLHSEHSKFVFTVHIILEGTVYSVKAEDQEMDV